MMQIQIPDIQTQHPIPAGYTFDGYAAGASSSNPGTTGLANAVEAWQDAPACRSLTAFADPIDENGWPIMAVWNDYTNRWDPWEDC
jgi:hypothetical protein